MNIPVQAFTNGFFSGFDFLKYWNIIVEYLHPLPVLIWAVIGGITGLTLTLLLLFLFRKKIGVQRCHFTLKWLSYTYFFIIPLFVGFSCGQWAALHNCENQLVKRIPKYLGDANALYNTYLKAEIEKIVHDEILKSSGNKLLDNAVGTAQSMIGSAIKDKPENEPESEIRNESGDKIKTYIVHSVIKSSYIRKIIVAETRNKIGKVLLMDKKLTNDFFDTEIQQLLNNGLLNTILEKHIRHLIGGLKANVLLVLFIGLAIPLTEIIIAHLLLRRKRAKNEWPETDNRLPERNS